MIVRLSEISTCFMLFTCQHLYLRGLGLEAVLEVQLEELGCKQVVSSLASSKELVDLAAASAASQAVAAGIAAVAADTAAAEAVDIAVASFTAGQDRRHTSSAITMALVDSASRRPQQTLVGFSLRAWPRAATERLGQRRPFSL